MVRFQAAALRPCSRNSVSSGCVHAQTAGTLFSGPAGASTTVHRAQITQQGQRAGRRGGLSNQLRWRSSMEIRCSSMRRAASASAAWRARAVSRAELEMHGAQLARQAQRLQRQRVAPPEFVAQLAGHVVVVEERRRPTVELRADVGGQGGQRRLVAGEQPERLDVEDEAVRRALVPAPGVLGRGQRVVAGIDLDQREARRVVAQPGLGVGGHGRRIKRPQASSVGSVQEAAPVRMRMAVRGDGRGNAGGRARGTGDGPPWRSGQGRRAERAPGYDSWIYEQLSGLCAPRPVPPSGPRRAWDCCHSPPMSDTQSPSSSAPQDRPDPLADLNPAQRAAVEFGVAPARPGRAAARTARCW